jgi:hypothetical protein
LIQPLVLFLLVLDVIADGLLIAPDRRNEISSDAKVLPYEALVALAVQNLPTNFGMKSTW